MSDNHHVNYKRVYLWLLALLVVSVAGPFIGILSVTLITAFGIAVVKANLVIQNFMHLRWEKTLAKWVLITSLALMALFVAGVAPDVMRHEGQNWVNVAAADAVERGVVDEHAREEELAEEETDVAVAEPGVFDAVGQFNLICAMCHGSAGDGMGAAGLALDPRPADFTDPAFWETRDDQRVKTAIRDGGVAVGASALMAPWGALYDDAQLDALVEYVRSFGPTGQ
ncbi:MAG: c-type cytochrome [Gemmatimonadota bacterium]|nr:c-type cytochrome [Gemmatimonadota bacterium]